MITRIWHGKTKTRDAAHYRQFVIDTGIQDYLKTRGISEHRYGNERMVTLRRYGQSHGGKIMTP